ncbi:MAG TPA: TlpA disulfide reductase family protein [Terriglobales bacterium]|nr:TlpA disulfide reductase family protein [Terriglobales bacterium]
MAALTPGTSAPDFTLPSVDGKKFSLKETLARGPVVVAFFKVSCPVCQYALPYLERIYKVYGNKKVTIVGVSQDKQRDTLAFIQEYGITFPVLLDDTNSYPVSNAYSLTNVPTVFWIAEDGEIAISSVGWSRKDVEDMHQKAAEELGAGVVPLFKPGEDVRDFRAG